MNELYTFTANDAFRFARVVGAETFRKGNELHFKFCPYCHGGKNRDTDTFAISLETGAWNCKRASCGHYGNMITLAQDFNGFSLGDGIDDYYLRRERFKKFVRKPIVVKDRAVEYLKGRGIPEEITRRYEVTIKRDTENILVFPFTDEAGDIWFIKYRNIEYQKGVTKGSKEWCEPNRKPILYGMNQCNFENPRLVLTEGQIDSLSLAAAGIENAVSVPLGKNGFTWVPYCFNFLGRFEELVVFGDYENGEISLLDGMKTKFHGTVKHVRPEDYRGCKDANEILIKYGKEALVTAVDNAVPVPVKGLRKMKDVQRVKLSDLDRMETGISRIDRDCGFYFGELIVLTGAAGDGKSTLASQWVTMAINQGFPAMIYSGEMPGWLVKNWIDGQIAGPHNLNRYKDIELDTYKKMTSWPAYEKLYVYDTDEEQDEQQIFDVLIKGIQQYGIRFIVIDNLMTALDFSDGLELNEAQTVFTRKLAKIAQDQNVIIVLIVHPRKSKFTSFSNDDIAGSSNIVNRAHKVIRYSRPDEKFTDKDGRIWEKNDLKDCPIRILTVLKDRINGNLIRDGIPLYFEKDTKRISDNGVFDWRLGWETDANGFITADSELDTIPF